MINAVIIDDEINSRNFLREHINIYCPNIKVLAEADSVDTGVHAIIQHSPEIIFLDVILGNHTGFEILDFLKQKEEALTFITIFTTAYDKYAIKAIKYSAFDYLLKPIDPDELIKVVQKMENNKTTQDVLKYDVLLGNYYKNEKKITVNCSEGIYICKLSELIRFEAQSNYTKIYLSNQKSILVSKPLKRFDEMLENEFFARIHKSHLVNINFIVKYNNGIDAHVLLSDNSKVPVSFRKKEAVSKIITALHQGNKSH